MTGPNKRGASKTSPTTPSKKAGNNEDFSPGRAARHPSPAGDGQLVWPLPDELWEVIGDSAAAHVLRSTADTDAYIKRNSAYSVYQVDEKIQMHLGVV